MSFHDYVEAGTIAGLPIVGMVALSKIAKMAAAFRLDAVRNIQTVRSSQIFGDKSQLLGKPELVAISHGALLDLLSQHCGIDTRRKKQIDWEAYKAADRAPAAARRAAVPVLPPPSWNEPMPAPRRKEADKPREPERRTSGHGQSLEAPFDRGKFVGWLV
jgi:hypothetical protein